MQDALNHLRVLEREEEGMADEDKKRILQQTVQKLKSIGPRFGESDQHNLVVWKNSASEGSQTSLSVALRLGSVMVPIN